VADRRRSPPTVTLATYLTWWVDEELVQRVADGVNTETTRQQYADRVRFQIAPLLGGVRLRDLSLERAVRYELIPSNPAKLVDSPTVQRSTRNTNLSWPRCRVGLARSGEG
jgi:hypothetical protein